MAKRKNRSKRSLGALPKGIPHKKAAGTASSSSGTFNPFELAGRHRKGPKHVVHNRHIGNLQQKKQQQQRLQQRASSSSKTSITEIRSPLKRRSQHLLQESLQRAKKANVFVDRRIGEYNDQMTAEDQNLARLVRERTRRSKKSTKYNLNDDGDYNDKGMLQELTHRGQVIDDEVAAKSILLSDDDDDDDDDGKLDAMDTALHFGGMGSGRSREMSAYGNSSAAGGTSMAQNYSQRKTELDDLILRRKTMKAERMKAREQQEEVIADLDGAFKELSSVLQFRDKEQEIRKHIKDKREGKLDKDAQEMDDWDKEIRKYTFMGKRAKATDRTKTPEEMAKEEADRLHAFETRRLARMNGDFSDDDFSDVSDEEDGTKTKRDKKGRKKSSKKNKSASTGNPDEIQSSDDENGDDGEELKANFTADGLVYVNKHGEVVKKLGDDEESDDGSSDGESDDDSREETKTDEYDPTSDSAILKVGTRVLGNYRAREQAEDREHWYDGVISKVNTAEDGTVTYNIDYEDGDFEEDVEIENVRPAAKSQEALEAEEGKKEEDQILKRKRQKAREKARHEIPFVFEVPTTLEALHAMIANHASTGEDASVIIQRIHASNSVKLDRRNAEKMQNFYDVLLRRFMAVGDAIYTSGDGGAELGRYQQLDAITKVLFKMTQDSPDCAAAVWGRRFGILQNAHMKRLRDAEFEREIDEADDEGDLSAWPSVGTVLLLRVVGHLFPVTDRRHSIVTPVVLLLGQMLSQTPILSMYDLAMGTMCAGLLVEYMKEAKRVCPEAIGFLAGVIRLYAHSAEDRTNPQYSVPTFESAACQPPLSDLRSFVSSYNCHQNLLPPLSVEKSDISDLKRTSASLLAAALHVVETYTKSLTGSVGKAERETFAEITSSLLCLKPNHKTNPMPKPLQAKVAATAYAVAESCELDQKRTPLMRRSMPTVRDTALKSLAPRLEDPDKYSKSKDKGKSAMQVAADRTRREYKREHKAVARELRLDAAFIEDHRRKEEEIKTTRARAERQRNFAWLEGEQAAMNQQVRLGGGLLKGGGMGAAKSKAASAKLGIKKGGKF